MKNESAKLDIPENIGLKDKIKDKMDNYQLYMVSAGPHQYADNFKNKGINLLLRR